MCALYCDTKRWTGQINVLIKLTAALLVALVLFLAVSRSDGPISVYRMSQNNSNTTELNLTTTALMPSTSSLNSLRLSSSTFPENRSQSITPANDLNVAKTANNFSWSTVSSVGSTISSSTSLLVVTPSPIHMQSNLSKSLTSKTYEAEIIPGLTYYATGSFTATCAGVGLSNRLFEFMSFYGIARTLNRQPYLEISQDCRLNQMKTMISFFPQIAHAFEMKLLNADDTTIVNFANTKCCYYEDVGKLNAYKSKRFLSVTGKYMQSFKYFDNYKADVKQILSFTSGDIAAADKFAYETFGNDTHYRICAHVRRGDFLSSPHQQQSTEQFTKSAVIFVRNKLKAAGKNSTVAIIGDDRNWISNLFSNDTWAHVFNKYERPTVDYAFVARHCQTVILTASASTFGFWSAYLSSAENVYYNVQFAKSQSLRSEFNPADYFPPAWISLTLNSTTNEVKEEPR